MKHIKEYEQFLCEKSGPCWDGYKIGSPKTKISSKSGKRVNNCVPVDEDVTEGTYNSKNHIGSTSDGQGSNAEIYKKGKGYYVVVSGEADYDFDAKNDKELLKKLKDNEFDSTDILEVNEARFVKSYDTKVNDAETKKEVLKIYPKAKFFVGKLTHFFGELEPNLFFKAYYPKYYKQDTGKSVKGDFKITSVYSKKGSNYVELMKESVTEAMDVNDPVLVAFRATRKELPKFTPAKAKSRRLSFDKYMDLLDDQTDIEQDIKDYAEEMAQTFRDMEQEAEPEGGEMADKYGSIMMKQEKEYAKLKAKKAKIDARIEKHRMS